MFVSPRKAKGATQCMSAGREGPVPALSRRRCLSKGVDIWVGAASDTVPSSFIRHLPYPCSCLDSDLLYKLKRYWMVSESWIITEYLTTTSSLPQAVRITRRRRQTVPSHQRPRDREGRPLLWAQPMFIHPCSTVIIMSSTFVGEFCKLWAFLCKSRV